MSRIIMVLGLAVLSVLLLKPQSAAAAAQLDNMSNTRQDNMNRVSFTFDNIPEFEIETSGQRVRVLFDGTAFSPSFRELFESDLLDPLMQVITREYEHESVVELYFRNFPANVDVVEEGGHTLHVNVFWQRESKGARPGISDERIGRVTPFESGAYAQRTITSEYAGKWIQFFEDFEWPAEISLPVNFTLPLYPGPFSRMHASVLPENVFDYGIGRLRELIEPAFSNKVNEFPELSMGGLPGDLAALMWAKCLLHDNEIEKAYEVLNRRSTGSEKDISNWGAYFHAWAMAASSHYHKAADLLEKQGGQSNEVNALFPWHRLLQAEIALALEEPKIAMLRLEQGGIYNMDSDKELKRIYNLRMADALYKIGDVDKAFKRYHQESSDLHFMQRYPGSLANFAALLYGDKQFETAYRYYFLLSEALSETYPDQFALARYWAAMSLYRSGQHVRSILLLWEIEDENRDTVAAVFSRLKLLDFDILGRTAPVFEEVMEKYTEIIKSGPTREIREEAFFKQILVGHLNGEDLRGVKRLGRFFKDFWAGQLLPEAQALLVELMPGVIDELVEEKAFFPALAIVARHRGLLAHAHITYDFLYNLAESYVNAEFPDQAARTYLYIFDFEKNKEKHERVFPPLIRIYSDQEKYRQVIEYASIYLEDYENGEYRDDVYYYYANALYKTGDFENAAILLHEQERPDSGKLDELAGRFFYEHERYDLAQRYFSRAINRDDDNGGIDISGINLMRAEMFFATDNYAAAFPIYKNLMDAPGYQGQAAYRLIQMFLSRGEKTEALNISRALVEMEAEGPWTKMTRELLRIPGK